MNLIKLQKVSKKCSRSSDGKSIESSERIQVKQVIAAGGVAANKGLRSSLKKKRFGMKEFLLTFRQLCFARTMPQLIAAAGSAMFIDGIRGNMTMNGKLGTPSRFME